MSLSVLELTHQPVELTINWNAGYDTEAVAYAAIGNVTKRIAEVVKDGNHYAAFWFGPVTSPYAIWIGDYGTQVAAMASVEDYASRVVISL